MTNDMTSVCRTDDCGTKFWRLPNGLKHRTDGPAVEGHGGQQEWWLNGKPHRIFGPAIIHRRRWYDHMLNPGFEQWYIDGVRLNCHPRQSEIEWEDDLRDEGLEWAMCLGFPVLWTAVVVRYLYKKYLCF